MYMCNVNCRMNLQGMMIQEACAVMNIIYSQSINWKKNMTTNVQHWNQIPGYPTLDDCPC